jgi:hypothetical protein
MRRILGIVLGGLLLASSFQAQGAQREFQKLTVGYTPIADEAMK